MRTASSRIVAGDRGFTLVEVTLAMGIVAFAVVSILGTIPIALNSARQSTDQGRASAIANTLFTSFRSQPFRNVRYKDSQYSSDGKPIAPGLDFSMLVPAPTSSTYTLPSALYARFVDPTGKGQTVEGDALGLARGLFFFDDTQGSASGFKGAALADYLITLNFSWPPGTVPVSGQVMAVQVEVVVTPAGSPKDQYYFVTTVTHRSN